MWFLFSHVILWIVANNFTSKDTHIGHAHLYKSTPEDGIYIHVYTCIMSWFMHMQYDKSGQQLLIFICHWWHMNL